MSAATARGEAGLVDTGSPQHDVLHTTIDRFPSYTVVATTTMPGWVVTCDSCGHITRANDDGTVVVAIRQHNAVCLGPVSARLAVPA